MKPNLVIGGGLYGCMVALLLARRGEAVVLIEREDDLLKHASYNNQARVHGGYHYPRSRVTGRRSRANIARFSREFGSAISRAESTLYAIARHESKVSPLQFEAFCTDIGTPLYQVGGPELSLFDSHMVAAVYGVDEPVFDAARLRQLLRQRIADAPIDVKLNHEVVSCRPEGDHVGVLVLDGSNLSGFDFEASRVFNCTYACLGGITVHESVLKTQLKHEITEMALIEMPPSLRGIGITVMDGDFWSSLPFPDRGVHTLSHVGHTPHFAWMEDGTTDPYTEMADYLKSARSRGAHMIRDAARYVPDLNGCRQVDSLWEVKTVLVRNESNDGRPILLEQHGALPIWSILGGKVDNVFDLLDRIETEILNIPQDVGITAGEAW